MRDINRAVEAVFRSLSDTGEASSIPTTRSMWEETAWLRPDTDLKTPDALHNDTEIRRVQALSVVALDNLLDEKPTNLEVVERTVALLADCSYTNARCQ